LRKLEVTVIGAGIGGLTAALSLHEIGAHVELFESAPSLEPIGVGINLLPHAVRELDALGLLDHLTEQAVLPETLVYCTRRGQEIWSEPRGRAAHYRWPQVSTHRGVLQQALPGMTQNRAGDR
jgi:2-polyprenyl-6-methoxyphenol hydroxylase-like FAD-dependent oxidoreductase